MGASSFMRPVSEQHPSRSSLLPVLPQHRLFIRSSVHPFIRTVTIIAAMPVVRRHSLSVPCMVESEEVERRRQSERVPVEVVGRSVLIRCSFLRQYGHPSGTVLRHPSSAIRQAVCSSVRPVCSSVTGVPFCWSRIVSYAAWPSAAVAVLLYSVIRVQCGDRNGFGSSRCNDAGQCLFGAAEVFGAAERRNVLQCFSRGWLICGLLFGFLC
jgi:hypothetical protein